MCATGLILIRSLVAGVAKGLRQAVWRKTSRAPVVPHSPPAAPVATEAPQSDAAPSWLVDTDGYEDDVPDVLEPAAQAKGAEPTSSRRERPFSKMDGSDVGLGGVAGPVRDGAAAVQQLLGDEDSDRRA